MSRQVIPEAAVEAAARVLVAHQRRDNRSCLCGWARLGFSHPTHQAALVLEAAAPHMLAEAWDEGSIAGWVEGGLPHSWNAENSLRNSNPYRSQP